MSTLQEWLHQQIAQSPHGEIAIKPAPRVSGGGDEILAAVGPAPEKVVYIGLRHNGDTLRVGFAAKDRWANEEVEEAVEGTGDTMTEWLADEMEADDDLDYEVQHFHDSGWFHFASDLPKSKAFFDTAEGRELLWYYFDGYCRAILPIVSGEDEE